jgi:hypothetical protein
MVLTQHRLRLAAVEQAGADKDVLLASLREQLAASAEHKVRLDEALALRQQQTETAERQATELSDEVRKGNRIIQHLQAELARARQRVKERGTTLMRLEGVIEENVGALARNERQLDLAQRDVAAARDEAERLKAALQQARDQLTEAQRSIESNTKIIDWLNRELNETKLGVFRSGGVGGSGGSGGGAAGLSSISGFSSGVTRSGGGGGGGGGGGAADGMFSLSAAGMPSTPFPPTAASGAGATSSSVRRHVPPSSQYLTPFVRAGTSAAAAAAAAAATSGSTGSGSGSGSGFGAATTGIAGGSGHVASLYHLGSGVPATTTTTASSSGVAPSSYFTPAPPTRS